MTLGAVQIGGVVLADRKGRRFFAIVTCKGKAAHQEWALATWRSLRRSD